MKITEYTKYQEQEEVCSRIEELDSNHNIIEEIDFDESENQQLRITYEYNQKNKATLIIQYDEDNQLIEKKSISYNEEGKVELTTIEFPDGSLSKEKKVKEGNSITLITEDEDGEFEGSVQHILDEKGLTKELIRTNFMNKVDSRLQYEYDDNKNTRKVIEQDPKGRFMKAYAFSYDENGNRTIEEELNKKDKIVARTIHKYDGSHLISSKTADESVYFHYQEDHMIKEERFNPDGSSDIIKFEYNDNKIISEKHFNIPQGEATEDIFMIMSKRYEHQK